MQEGDIGNPRTTPTKKFVFVNYNQKFSEHEEMIKKIEARFEEKLKRQEDQIAELMIESTSVKSEANENKKNAEDRMRSLMAELESCRRQMAELATENSQFKAEMSTLKEKLAETQGSDTLFRESVKENTENTQRFFSVVRTIPAFKLEEMRRKSAEICATLTPELINSFLSSVVRGNLEEVRSCLVANTRLVDVLGDVEDASGRKFTQITAFQYAVWALDRPMWELLLELLPPDQARNQKEVFETGRKDLTHKYGAHFDLKDLIGELGTYINHYEKWSVEERERRWCIEVSGAQRKLPAWLIYMWSEEGEDVAWTKQDVNRAVLRENCYRLALGDWFTDGEYKLGHADLGRASAFAWCRGRERRVRATRVCGVDYFSVEDYPRSPLLGGPPIWGYAGPEAVGSDYEMLQLILEKTLSDVASLTKTLSPNPAPEVNHQGPGPGQ